MTSTSTSPDDVAPAPDPRALPPAWRDPGAADDAPANDLPFLGATPVPHRGLLVHAPAVAGLMLALLEQEPALGSALLDATWGPDDPHRAPLEARLQQLLQWAHASLLDADAPAEVDENAPWRDRLVELSDLLMPVLPLLFTPEIIEGELQVAADLSPAGALRKLTAVARESTLPAPVLAPLVVAALMGTRSAADVADQLALPGADERQLLRRLQERFDAWEAPTWAAIVRVTAAAWREAAPWRRLLLHAQLDRLQIIDAAIEEQATAADAADGAREAQATAVAEAESARRALAKAEREIELLRAAASDAQALQLQLEEARIRQQRIAERRDLLESRLDEVEAELARLRQTLSAAEHQREHFRRLAEGEPEVEEADQDDDENVEASVAAAPAVPPDFLAGYRVALFTGHENAGVRARMLDVLKAIGAGDDAQVHLIRGATRGNVRYGAGDLVLVDCRFVSHKDTERLATRVDDEALLLNLHRGTGGLQAELFARLHRTDDGRLVPKR
jgi:hypothetical protein